MSTVKTAHPHAEAEQKLIAKVQQAIIEYCFDVGHKRPGPQFSYVMALALVKRWRSRAHLGRNLDPQLTRARIQQIVDRARELGLDAPQFDFGDSKPAREMPEMDDDIYGL